MSVFGGGMQAGVPAPGCGPDGAVGGIGSHPSGVSHAAADAAARMAAPTEAVSDAPTPCAPAESEEPIRAYAKLEFPGFSYYIQTLDVTIGRRAAADGAHAAPAARRTYGDVDVDLGPLKSISRLHARVFYAVQPSHYRNAMAFSPMVAHAHVPGERPADASAWPPDSASATEASPASPRQRESRSASAVVERVRSTPPGEEQGRFMLEVLGRNGAFVDDVWVRMNGLVPLGRRTKIQIAERVFYFVLPPPIYAHDATSAADTSDMSVAGDVSGAGSDAASSSELSDVDAPPAASRAPRFVLKPRAKAAAGAKRPAGDAAPDAKRRRGPAGGGAREGRVAGMGPGGEDGAEGGKSPHGSGEADAPAAGHTEKSDGTSDDDDASVEEVAASGSPLVGASSLSALAAAAQRIGEGEPGGVSEKPDVSNVDLITHALTSDFSAGKGGKLTLQEVYEWLQRTYPWFHQNSRKTGRDWHSSIRHTIGTSREFAKVPRRPDEHGKGIFYALSRGDAARVDAATGDAAPTPAGSDGRGAADARSGTPGAPNTGQTASMPRIPLVVGIPPSDAQGAPRPRGTPGTIESLLETPPIAHHQGRLYLSPAVFGHLSADQLAYIEGMGAQQALQVLQKYLVTHLKERMKRQTGDHARAQGVDAPAHVARGQEEAAAPRRGLSAEAMAALSAADAPAAAASSAVPSVRATPVPSAPHEYDHRLEPPTVPQIPAPRPAATPCAPSTPSIPTPHARGDAGSSTAAGASSTPSVPNTDAAAAAPAAPAAAAAPATSARTMSASAAPTDLPAPTRSPAHDNPLAALSALAAHPEAAGLIALLQKQQAGAAPGTVNLTPGQLELLQLANRLAALKKDKKKHGGAGGAPG
ncbi:Pre-rRNA-processing protein fhl1 [Malassezia sp. CBS 17886]|nr:Pre-rRNA-processing protein fhl1 [Malassezia sp. CBS 17886]